jgi:putative acetyltransferase
MEEQNMITLKKTDSNDKNFQQLVVELDHYLAIIDGEEHAFYAQYNKTDAIKHVVVAYLNERPVACGAIKHYTDGTMEVKRMYAAPDVRGKGVASLVLGELEDWAGSLLYQHCVLETGKKQADAVRLYEKNGYQIIPNYGQYIGAENSVCFEKRIPIIHA